MPSINQIVSQIDQERKDYDILYTEQGIFEMVNLDAYPVECYDDDGWYLGILNADGSFSPQELPKFHWTAVGLV